MSPAEFLLTFRRELASPAVVTLALLPWAGLLLSRSWIEQRLCRTTRATTDRALAVGGAITLAGTAIPVLFYLARTSFVGRLEPNLITTSWIFFHGGEPLYHPLDSPRLYSLLYGPTVYWALGGFLELFGGSIRAAKIPGVLSFLGSLGLLYGALRSRAAAGRCLAWTALVALLALSSSTAYAIKGDPLLALAIALALFATTRRSATGAVVLLALATGFGAQLKLHCLVYFLPFFARLFWLRGARPLAAAAVSSVGLMALPFASSAVSAERYLELLGLGFRHGLSARLATLNALHLLLLLILFVLPFRSERKTLWGEWAEEGGFLALILMGMILVAVPASKPGSGFHHLLPFAYPLAFWAAARPALGGRSPGEILDGERGRRLVATAWVSAAAACFVAAWAMQVSVVSRQLRVDGAAIVEDLRQLARAHPGERLQMGMPSAARGVGGPPCLDYTRFRTELVFAGNPVTLDPVVVTEYRAAGRPLPAPVIAGLRSCAVDAWVIPSCADRDQPFAIRKAFPPRVPLFDAAFREAFLASYERAESTRFFDLWRCREPPPAASPSGRPRGDA